MVGQIRLQNDLMSRNLRTLPHTMLIVGADGCGKHTLASMVSQDIGLKYVEFDDIGWESVMDASVSLVPTLLVIDADGLDDRKQNAVLKLAEEPQDNVYMAILATSENRLLYTLRCRCETFRFSPYSDDELRQFVPKGVDEQDALACCRTPGRMKSLNAETLDSAKSLCANIASKIGNASLGNALRIADKISVSDGDGKIPVWMFVSMLSAALTEEFVRTKDARLAKMHGRLSEVCGRLTSKRYSKEKALSAFVCDLWSISKGVNDNGQSR